MIWCADIFNQLLLINQVTDPSRRTFEYLIGTPISEFPPRQLPLKIDILQLYSNFQRNVPDKERIKFIIESIEICYRNANIPIIRIEAIRLKIKRLLLEFKDLLSKRKVDSNMQRKRENDFAKNIRNLFEVANETLLSNRQTQFLLDQRTTRGEFFDLIANNIRTEQKIAGPSNSAPRLQPNLDAIETNGEDDDFEYVPSSESDEDIEEKRKRRKKEIPMHLLRKINETKGSYRISENLMKVGVELAGGRSSEYGISKSNLWLKLKQLRTDDKENILRNLAASDYKVIVQFDCKRYHRINQRHIGTEERIIILIHSENGDIPLGLFSLNSHSGANCSNEVMRVLDEHNLRERLVGIVSDTEAVNTGRISGACVLIENELETDLLHIMCRHHILELVLKSIFEQTFGRSTGPTGISQFRSLIQKWEEIKRGGFVYETTEDNDLNESEAMRRLVHQAKEVLIIHTTNKNVRNDYAEVTDLALKFLGVPTRSTFKVPGAVSNARWMNKIIYSFKMYLFRHQLDLDQDMIEKLKRFYKFIAVVFIKYWNQCSVAFDAPINDLNFLKELEIYKNIDRIVAMYGSIAFKRHLWYLSEELMILSLFSKKVSVEEKDSIRRLLIPGDPIPRRSCNSIRYQGTIRYIQNLNLHNFATTRSKYLFSRLNINARFLEEPAANWHQLKSYKTAETKIRNLIVVVNDSCERLLRQGELLITEQRVRSDVALQSAIIVSGTNSRYIYE